MPLIRNSSANEGSRNDGLLDNRIAMSDCAAYGSSQYKTATTEYEIATTDNIAYSPNALDEDTAYENYDYVI